MIGDLHKNAGAACSVVSGCFWASKNPGKIDFPWVAERGNGRKYVVVNEASLVLAVSVGVLERCL